MPQFSVIFQKSHTYFTYFIFSVPESTKISQKLKTSDIMKEINKRFLSLKNKNVEKIWGRKWGITGKFICFVEFLTLHFISFSIPFLYVLLQSFFAPLSNSFLYLWPNLGRFTIYSVLFGHSTSLMQSFFIAESFLCHFFGAHGKLRKWGKSQEKFINAIFLYIYNRLGIVVIWSSLPRFCN